MSRALPVFTLLLLYPAFRPEGLEASQREPSTNPADAKSIEQGMNLYRFRCAVCHGIDGRGERATDLTETVHEKTDAQLFRVLERGIPGTEMPAAPLHGDEIGMVVAYLRTLGGAPAATDVGGDGENGRKIFWGKAGCGLCHLVNGNGGRLGPDLSRIGSARSRQALTREIRNPSEYITPGYETVTAVKSDGAKIRGCRKSEDAFSIQLMDTGEDLRSYLKKDLLEVTEEATSLMPVYGSDRLNDADLRDLLRYLGSLRGASAANER